MPTNNDPNRPTTERNEIGVESLRRLRARQMLHFSKENLAGLQQERNLEGDDEMVIGKATPLPPNAKWPFFGQESDGALLTLTDSG